MRILLINDYKTNIAGTEMYMWSLKNELEKRGHKVAVFGSDVSVKKYMNDQKVKSPTIYIKRLFNIKAYLEFKKFLKNFKPDIIHLQNIFNEITPSILLATQNIPVIMTIHDNQIVNPVAILSERTGKECKKRTCGGCINCIGPKGALYEFVKRKLHRQLLKKVLLYLTPSNYMENLVREAGFSPVLNVPNGTSFFKYSKIRNFNNLLYVGRLTKEKGIEYLLRAMPKVINQYPNIKLTIVGDGENKNYFINLAKDLKVMNNVKFTGPIKNKDLEIYYKNSAIVIVPSIYQDNFPTVCLEALSMGRPIIGTNRGGIPELIENKYTGLIIPPYNSNKLTKAIINLLSDTQMLEKMSKNAKNKSQLLTLNNNINSIETIYNKLVTSKKDLGSIKI